MEGLYFAAEFNPDIKKIKEQARIEEQKRILQVVDDYYNLYASEFCDKYKIKEKNPDMWDANKIIREALERGGKVMDRERIAGEIQSILIGSPNQDSPEKLAQEIVDVLPELGYTRPAEPADLHNEDRVKAIEKILHQFVANIPDSPLSEIVPYFARSILKLFPAPELTLKRLEQAVYDNREGKPLDLTEQEYELFYMIFNDGKNQFEPVELEALGDEERMDINIPCETCDKKPNWISPTSECMDCVAKCFIQATIQHNQSKGQLFRVKEG